VDTGYSNSYRTEVESWIYQDPMQGTAAAFLRAKTRLNAGIYRTVVDSLRS
jgi:hypothetical protein